VIWGKGYSPAQKTVHQLGGNGAQHITLSLHCHTHTEKEKNVIFPTLSSSNSLATCGISGVM